MSHYTLAPESRQDLKDIYQYVAAEKPLAAEKLYHSIMDGIRLLARQPLIGQACPNLRDELYAFNVGNYVIFYVPTRHGVQIERVIHGVESLI